MSKKIGKDVIGNGKGAGIIRTKKDQEDYEEYKRQKLAQDQVEQEKEEEKKKVGSEKMIDEKEPTPDQLAKQKAEVLADIRKLKLKKVVLKDEE